jgi:hypothetical protein
LWLIAPRPETITQAYDRVIAWNLGRRLTAADTAAARGAVEDLVRSDPFSQRPTIVGADDHLDEYSRFAGIVLHERPVWGTGFDLANFALWLRARADTCRAGAPGWVGIETLPDSALRQQWDLLVPGSRPAAICDYEALRCLTYAALASGARGMFFRSTAPLDDSPQGRARADGLRLINHELSLLEPWTAIGRRRDELSGVPPQVRVAVLQAERSRVVLVTQHMSAMQHAPAPAPLDEVQITIPGIPVSDRPYLLGPTGLQHVRSAHTSAGLRFTLSHAGLAAAVVITQDPLAVNHLFRNAHDARLAVARWRSQTVADLLAETTTLDRELAAVGNPLAGSTTWLREARTFFDDGQKLMAAGDVDALHSYLTRVNDGLLRVRRGHWERTAATFPSPIASPFCADFASLPVHYELAGRISRARWSDNMLPHGDMESLDLMLASGWQQTRQEGTTLNTDVVLAGDEPHSGAAALKLTVLPAPGKSAPALVEQPLISIASAPFTVTPGQIMRIHGWVRVPRTLSATYDGLVIHDEMNGPTLGERVLNTRGWREFTLYRAAPRGGSNRVIVSMAGVGEARIDGLSVTLVLPEVIREAGVR